MSRRSFDDVRKPSSPALKLVADEPIESVARRLFFTGADGPRVLGWMREQVNAPSPPNASAETLREAEGARRFVAGLIQQMGAKPPA